MAVTAVEKFLDILMNKQINIKEAQLQEHLEIHSPS
jgi:hypothetical protein